MSTFGGSDPLLILSRPSIINVADPENCFKLFKFVKKAVTPSDKPGRYDVPRAGLILLSKHAGLFGQILLDEHRMLYQHLGHWSRHGNREMKALGAAALEAFLREACCRLLVASLFKKVF